MRVCILVLFLAAGCTDNVHPVGNSVTGHVADAGKKVFIPVNPTWKLDVWQESRKAIFASLQNPKTGELTNTPAYDAYYDTQRNLSFLAVYGNLTSKGDYGQVFKQSYYVTWQQKGKADTQTKPWEFADVAINDVQF